MKTKFSISILLTAVLLCSILTAVSADIAPPLQPPGASPAPLEYEKTYVEMSHETVQIFIEESSHLYYMDPPRDCVNARVHATFIMFNQGDDAETLKVLFPLNNIDGGGDGFFSSPEIQNLKIWIEHQPIGWVEITTPNPRGSDEPDIKWAEFEVEFTLEDTVWIDIYYDLQSTGNFPEATFKYILETGGGWYGPIGTAYIELMFSDYMASFENVLIGNQTSPGGDIDGGKMVWEYTNLEPDASDNWEVTIIAPHIWEQIIDLRERIDQGDGSAYTKITKLYDNLIMDRGVRPGAEGFIPLNYDAYQKALEFDPKDDDVLARFADFMLFMYETDSGTPETPVGLEDIYAMASQALEINPLNDLAPRVINWLEKSLDFTPAAPSTTTEQPPNSSSQSTEEELADDAASVDVPREDLNQGSESQNNTIPYLLGAGLLAAVGVILVLVYKLGKKNAS